MGWLGLEGGLNAASWLGGSIQPGAAGSLGPFCCPMYFVHALQKLEAQGEPVLSYGHLLCCWQVCLGI